MSWRLSLMQLETERSENILKPVIKVDMSTLTAICKLTVLVAESKLRMSLRLE